MRAIHHRCVLGSWTSPLAIVRYVHHPNGLESPAPANSSAASSASAALTIAAADEPPPRKAAIGSVAANPFDLWNSSRISRWRSLRDGDLVEIEQWGGLLGADECP